VEVHALSELPIYFTIPAYSHVNGPAHKVNKMLIMNHKFAKLANVP